MELRRFLVHQRYSENQRRSENNCRPENQRRSDSVKSTTSREAIPSIGLFLPSLAGGGAERAALNLAIGFAQRGCKVDLVLQNAVGAFLAKVPPNIRIIDLKSANVVAKLFDLMQYLRQEQPTVLLSMLDSVNVATWAKQLTRVSTKVMVGVQNTLSQDFQGRAAHLKPLLVRSSYAWADAIVAASEGVATDIARMSGLTRQDIHVIYNPVVTPDLIAQAEQPIAHPWLATGELPVVLGVGRLTMQKDFPTLIQAFAQVRSHLPAKLMILGEGEDKPKLQSLVDQLHLTDHVCFVGFVDNPYAYMRQANLFVLSSAWEGFGNVLAEAIATGTSVVSTDCPSGPAEILAQGQYGQLVPVGDVSALAMAIAAALQQPTDPQILQQRSMDFSIETVVDQYLSVMGITV